MKRGRKEREMGFVSPSQEEAVDSNRDQPKGILSRMWNGVFGRREEDYEKKLRHLSKEESLVHAKLKRRAQRWRIAASNIVVFTFAGEVVATIYAIATTRSVDLNSRMRAIRVLPIFAIPCLSFVIYSTLACFTKLIDRSDQETVESLREERQAKINELKEITNYYTTQQLIQRYDVDPEAKAAAATILASQLGADTGMKFSMRDESIIPNDPTAGENKDTDLAPTVGVPFLTQNEVVDGQYKSSGAMNQGWIPRLAAMLVGEDPTQCYAVICRNCHMHNGLCRKEDYPYITYYCPHCCVLNGPQQVSEEQEQDHFSTSVSVDQHGSVGESTQITTKTEVNTNSTIVEEQRQL